MPYRREKKGVGEQNMEDVVHVLHACGRENWNFLRQESRYRVITVACLCSESVVLWRCSETSACAFHGTCLYACPGPSFLSRLSTSALPSACVPFPSPLASSGLFPFVPAPLSPELHTILSLSLPFAFVFLHLLQLQWSPFHLPDEDIQRDILKTISTFVMLSDISKRSTENN